MALSDRLQHAWNAFLNRDPTRYYGDYGVSSYYRPDRMRLTMGNERSIVVSVYNRIALDVAYIDIFHARLDEDGRYTEQIASGLNECLTLSANMDQTGKAFLQDVVMSMMDEGCVAIVPVETTTNPTVTGSFDMDALNGYLKFSKDYDSLTVTFNTKYVAIQELDLSCELFVTWFKAKLFTMIGAIKKQIDLQGIGLPFDFNQDELLGRGRELMAKLDELKTSKMHWSNF